MLSRAPARDKYRCLVIYVFCKTGERSNLMLLLLWALQQSCCFPSRRHNSIYEPRQVRSGGSRYNLYRSCRNSPQYLQANSRIGGDRSLPHPFLSSFINTTQSYTTACLLEQFFIISSTTLSVSLAVQLITEQMNGEQRIRQDMAKSGRDVV